MTLEAMLRKGVVERAERSELVATFDEVRQLRNAIRYKAAAADGRELAEAIAMARAVVAAVSTTLR